MSFVSHGEFLRVSSLRALLHVRRWLRHHKLRVTRLRRKRAVGETPLLFTALSRRAFTPYDGDYPGMHSHHFDCYALSQRMYRSVYRGRECEALSADWDGKRHREIKLRTETKTQNGDRNTYGDIQTCLDSTMRHLRY
ncbi:hypothetical protein PUN28_015864 [Cardiocondyla obscurior]|uniref:Uncharacterized protein n=1 Tax=Cardiocondyla obscurior TaxID=286306 RepID=A0AAW2EUY3_9HYME